MRILGRIIVNRSTLTQSRASTTTFARGHVVSNGTHTITTDSDILTYALFHTHVNALYAMQTLNLICISRIFGTYSTSSHITTYCLCRWMDECAKRFWFPRTTTTTMMMVIPCIRIYWCELGRRKSLIKHIKPVRIISVIFDWDFIKENLFQ